MGLGLGWRWGSFGFEVGVGIGAGVRVGVGVGLGIGAGIRLRKSGGVRRDRVRSREEADQWVSARFAFGANLSRRAALGNVNDGPP